jgi:hypothetical protein
VFTNGKTTPELKAVLRRQPLNELSVCVDAAAGGILNEELFQF